MACFLVPAAEALVTTVAGKVMEKKEGSHSAEGHEVKIPFTRKIGWLNNMLWADPLFLHLSMYGMVRSLQSSHS